MLREHAAYLYQSEFPEHFGVSPHGLLAFFLIRNPVQHQPSSGNCSQLRAGHNSVQMQRWLTAQEQTSDGMVMALGPTSTG